MATNDFCSILPIGVSYFGKSARHGAYRLWLLKASRPVSGTPVQFLCHTLCQFIVVAFVIILCHDQLTFCYYLTNGMFVQRTKRFNINGLFLFVLFVPFVLTPFLIVAYPR